MKILVVSPHPDDETLGAGGTLLKMKSLGNTIFWLNITDMKEEYGWSSEQISHRRNQIKAVNDFYGFVNFFNLEYPPARLSEVREDQLIADINKVFNTVKPDWIIIPGHYDAHSDHRIVYNCCMACAKSFRAQYIKRIITMEIISETDYGFQKEKFDPNFFVDITDYIEKKAEALSIYDTEIQDRPFPRSTDNVKALAMFRGSAFSVEYAEAFQIIKQIE